MYPKKHSTHLSLLKQSKQAFTLIEVMVALTLVSILLAVGFGAYSQMSLLEREGDQLRHAALQQRLAQTRLASLFLRIPLPNSFFEKKDPKKLPSRVFYSSSRTEPGLFRSGSLVFTYDNQTDLWPEFCNDVIARLYVKEPTGQEGDTQGALWLATWPRPACSMDFSLARYEQILEGVKELHYSFYAPPPSHETSSKEGGSQQAGTLDAPPRPAPTLDSWNDTWAISYSKLPAIVHLHLIMEEKNGKKVEPLDFYFPLVIQNPPLLREDG